MARPGIMIYFDILEPVRMLPDADKGRLLMAMLEYGRDGVVPDLDGPLGIVWSFVHPMIDKDGQRYDDMKLQREYAAFCKKRKKIWMPKISFDDWVCMTEDERQRAVDPVASRNPTTATSTTATSTGNSNIQHQPTTPTNNINVQHQLQPQHTTSTGNSQLQGDGDFAAAAADRKLKRLNGELGQGVVNLSEYQVDMLLDKLGIDMFDYYVGKLANFIIHEGATVRNHYQTILKWFTEDSSC